MNCLLVILSMICPRLLMCGIWIFTEWFSLAYETSIYPFLGFLFLPLTTLAYMATMLCNEHELSGWWIVLIVVAVVSDLGSNTNTGVEKQ